MGGAITMELDSFGALVLGAGAGLVRTTLDSN